MVNNRLKNILENYGDASDPYNGKYYYDWDGAIEDFKRRNYRFRWLGPTGLGITLSYDLLQRN